MDSEFTNKLIDAVKEKNKTYDPSAANEEAKEFDTTEQVGFFYMCFKYASGGDIALFSLAVLASFVFGASMPAFSIIFGDVIDGVGGVNSFGALTDSSLMMLYIGLVVYFVSYLQITGFSVFAQRIAHKIRVNYFR